MFGLAQPAGMQGVVAQPAPMQPGMAMAQQVRIRVRVRP